MKVLVTGAAGFLGSHVCELFKAKRWDVVGYDNLTKFELNRTPYNAEAIRQYMVDFLKSIGVPLVVGDIRAYDKLIKAAEGCDYIINCAAQPAMTVAVEKPHYDADVNIMGALNVLTAGRFYKIPVALCSTIHVYGNGINKCLSKGATRFHLGNINYTEYGINEKGGFDPESTNDVKYLSGDCTPLHVSKYTEELYARAFIESYQSKVFVARLTGIYGERQFGGEDHGWVANFAISTLMGYPIKVFGTDKQCRDILYAKDAARAFYDWFVSGQEPGVFNIGGGISCLTSLKDCLEELELITGKKQNISLLPARPGDLWYFCCDTTKAGNSFGWLSVILPNNGLLRLVKWVKENKELFRK
jgi:CDP-paratose 2-epimerase